MQVHVRLVAGGLEPPHRESIGKHDPTVRRRRDELVAESPRRLEPVRLERGVELGVVIPDRYLDLCASPLADLRLGRGKKSNVRVDIVPIGLRDDVTAIIDREARERFAFGPLPDRELLATEPAE